jgi:glycosyltransferase involved in cell wall biosynthesis
MIFLIDPYGQNNHGHHWNVSIQFLEALIEGNLEFAFVSPTALLAKKEIEARYPNKKINAIQTSDDPTVHKQSVATLITDASNVSEKSIFVFSWLGLFSESQFQDILENVSNTAMEIHGVSGLSKASVENYNSEYHFEFELIFQDNPNCKTLWVWHEPNPRSTSHKVRRLPEFHFSLPREIPGKRSRIRISFFGRISPFRGVAELLIIALLNPRLEVFIKGLGFSRWGLWRPARGYRGWKQQPLTALVSILISAALSALRFLPNVEFDSTPFPSELELANAIARSDIIFVGCKLPLSTGIGLSAMASGVPVMWFGRTGEGARLLQIGSDFGRLRYAQIFLPGYATKRAKEIVSKKTAEIFSRKEMYDEITGQLFP